jgi:hypothetical protein
MYSFRNSVCPTKCIYLITNKLCVKSNILNLPGGTKFTKATYHYFDQNPYLIVWNSFIVLTQDVHPFTSGNSFQNVIYFLPIITENLNQASLKISDFSDIKYITNIAFHFKCNIKQLRVVWFRTIYKWR